LNRTYIGRVIEDPDTKDSNTWKDKIIFKNNKIYFKVFSKNWRFPYATCTFSVDSTTHIITFKSERVRNSDNDSRILSGTISHDSIEGTVRILRYDGVWRPYSFLGKMK